MEPFAARAFKRGLKPTLLEPLPHIPRSELDGFKRHFGSGIKIEDHAVRIIDRMDRSAPGMNLDRSHLDHFEQPLLVIDVEVFVAFALVPELEGMDFLAQDRKS